MIAYRITEKGRELIRQATSVKSPPIKILTQEEIDTAEILCRLFFKSDYYNYAPECLDEKWSALVMKMLEQGEYIKCDPEMVLQEANRILDDKQIKML